MLWLIIVIAAYFLNAISAIIDKFLISKKIPQPVVYTFYISVLGIIALVLIPFGFQIPHSWLKILITLSSGAAFTFALLFLFYALKLNETTKITPLIGGLSPFFVFELSYLFLNEQLSQREISAFFILIFGTVLITLNLEAKKSKGIAGFDLAIISAFLFAVHYVLTKFAYSSQPFVSAFVWIRIGSFLTAMLFLISAANRKTIFETFKFSRPKQRQTGGLFLAGQTAGAGSALLVNYAIFLASVSLVNALQGIQYVFLLAMAVILAKKNPHILEEKLTPKIFIQKSLAIILILIGLFVLSFNKL